MSVKLFVGSLAWGTSDESLAAHFAQAGAVASARVVKDRETNRSRGFGFVEFESDADGQAAISQLNGSLLDGRNITVNEARPQEDRPRGGSNFRR